MEEKNTGTPSTAYRSEFINRILQVFHDAEEIVESHHMAVAAFQKNYIGEKLYQLLQAEKIQYQNQIIDISEQMNSLKEKEIQKLMDKKEDELQNAPENILNVLSSQADILTDDEIQLIADRYKDSYLIQRRIKAIAEKKDFAITIYPEIDKKIAAVSDIASVYMDWIQRREFGLEVAIYEKNTLKTYDDILEPQGKGDME